MCSVSTSRSAPATGMSAFFSARMIASNSAPRCRTRISTSFGRPALPLPGRDGAGDAARELHLPLVAVWMSNGASQPGFFSSSSDFSSSQISTRPGAASGSASWIGAAGSAV